MSSRHSPITMLSDGAYDTDLQSVYGNARLATQKRRYATLLQAMQKAFGESSPLLVRAPGRTELGGNHTDHNGGCVLTAAIQLDCAAAAIACERPQVHIRSHGYGEPLRVDLADLSPRAVENHNPAALVRGVAAGLVGRGFRIGGFKACLDSTLPPGSGLSSSAAFAVLAGTIWSHLYNDGGVPPLDLATSAHLAETQFFGKPCGMMDQLSSAMGGLCHIDFLQQRPAVERIIDPFSDSEYGLLVVNTGGSHETLTDAYAAITVEMKQVARLLGRPMARGLQVEDILGAMSMLRKHAGDRAILRALHFVAENERVGLQVQALREKRIEPFLELVRISADSSWRLLQNCVNPADPQRQGIALALAVTERHLGKNGVSRVHGGGFAGTIQAYVPRNQIPSYRRYMEAIFGAGSVIPLAISRAGAVRIGFV